MAELACPSCGKVVKGEHGLSLHIRRWCHNNESNFTNLLQQRREFAKTTEEEERKRLRLEMEHQADRERLVREQDALRAQRLADFQSLAFNASDPTEEVEQRPSGLPIRNRRLPQHYRDDPPALLIPVPTPVVAEEPESSYTGELDNPAPVDNVHMETTDSNTRNFASAHSLPYACTQPDGNDLFRQYQSNYPSHDPEDSTVLEHLCDGPTFQRSEGSDTQLATPRKSYFAPFLNATVWRLVGWFYNGSTQKSLDDLNNLVHNVILADDFDRKDLRDFSAQWETWRLDKAPNDPSSSFFTADGWHTTSIPIRLPCEKVKQPEAMAPEFWVEGLHYRKITDVVKSAFEEPAAQTFHTVPYKLFWQPDKTRAPERIITELYTSDAMLREHEKVKSSPKVPGCNLETIIAAIMLWSDSTHLASFGNAALWPIYLFLGNQSKYTRARPTSFAAHHLAYIPKLSDTIQDFYMKTFGTSATAPVLTHCKRELMQGIWSFLLDSDFLHAYEYGMVIKFPDGIFRRVFCRLFTYAADYPEKILLACMKFLGNCPCPRCLVAKGKIYKLGSRMDQWVRNKKTRIDDEARRWSIENVRKAIFEFGRSILSKAVEGVIGAKSLVPTRNAFSEKVAKFGFNFYSMLVPDFMHEFKLGVWKATLTHLIRILYTTGDNAVQELNARFRLVPTFGRDTIRKFSNNVSGLTKLAARDFEDILQCTIPVFDGLLPEPYNTIVLDLLFELATWHAFGKLRMHTETTLFHFGNCTARLGQAFRKFSRDCCSKFTTYDLPRETAARARRRGAQSTKTGTVGGTTGVGSKCRVFNMSTYKLHALGDYVKSIWEFGTTDNYSTQVGELEHRRVKRFYTRTNKISFTHAIAKHQQRERLLHQIREQNHTVGQAIAGNAAQESARDTVPNNPSLHFVDQEPLPNCPPELHYQISQGKKYRWDLSAWLSHNKNDLALMDFLPKLKSHILGRLIPGSMAKDEVEFTTAQRNALLLINNCIYRHKVLRINYTTYDLRRAQDSLNPRTHSDIMVLSHEDLENAHPYWYARIIGIFHVDVQYRGPELHKHAPERIDFLWVRWFARNRNLKTGWAMRRLPCIGFYPQGETEAFGFINPEQVVRAAHLIPAFRFGRTTALLPPSIARRKCDNDEDWDWYYVNMFVDRDMFMRYRGGGVGHKSTCEATRCLFNDREKLDRQTFTFEHDRELFEEENEDDTPMDDSSSMEEESSEESVQDVSETEGVDAGDDDQLIGDDLGDEMEEYGYSGLDQVLDDNEGDAETFDDEDALGPEDGEGPDDEVEDATL